MSEINLTEPEVEALRSVAAGDWGIPEQPCRSLESKGLVKVVYYWTLTETGRALVEKLEGQS